jgi:hypothetical protein
MHFARFFVSPIAPEASSLPRPSRRGIKLSPISSLPSSARIIAQTLTSGFDFLPRHHGVRFKAAIDRECARFESSTWRIAYARHKFRLRSALGRSVHTSSGPRTPVPRGSGGSLEYDAANGSAAHKGLEPLKAGLTSQERRWHCLTPQDAARETHRAGAPCELRSDMIP